MWVGCGLESMDVFVGAPRMFAVGVGCVCVWLRVTAAVVDAVVLCADACAEYPSARLRSVGFWQQAGGFWWDVSVCAPSRLVLLLVQLWFDRDGGRIDFVVFVVVFIVINGVQKGEGSYCGVSIFKIERG